MSDDRHPLSPAGTGRATEKSPRLASALRANLARRKAQSRARRAGDGPDAGQDNEQKNNEQD